MAGTRRLRASSKTASRHAPARTHCCAINLAPCSMKAMPRPSMTPCATGLLIQRVSRYAIPVTPSNSQRSPVAKPAP